MNRLASNSNPNCQFTPGAERAFEFAEVWESREGSNEIYPPDLLRGLLAEPECRGALLLAAAGIDDRAVLEHWPQMCQRPGGAPGRAKQFSPEVHAAIGFAYDCLIEFEQPVLLATEHLVLGLVGAPGEMADWLRERGLDRERLEAEVHRLAGHELGPLPIDDAPLEKPPGEAPSASDRDALKLAVGPQEAGEAPPRESAPPAAAEPTRGARDRPRPLAPRERSATWRVLDAAGNRAGEGLRVVEDYVRFVLDDRQLTAEAKQLRHDLAAVLMSLPAPPRSAARNVPGDVGALLTTAAEQSRASARDVALASCKRAQQSLRSLEEFAKTVAPAAARSSRRCDIAVMCSSRIWRWRVRSRPDWPRAACMCSSMARDRRRASMPGLPR